MVTAITVPKLDNPDLAYETGFHLGDGSMYVKKRRNEYKVSYFEDNTTERSFFVDKIIPLIKNLYGLEVKLMNQENTCYVRINSKQLVQFKISTLGLPVGPKDKLTSLFKIPLFHDKRLLPNLLAGLFDSDGCVKLVKKKYPKITIGLKSEIMIKEIKEILRSNFNINSTVYMNVYFDKRINKNTITWILEINGFDNFHLFLSKIPLRNTKYFDRMKAFGLS